MKKRDPFEELMREMTIVKWMLFALVETLIFIHVFLLPLPGE